MEIRSEKLKDAAGASNFNAIPADQTLVNIKWVFIITKTMISGSKLRVEGLRVERGEKGAGS